MWDGKAVRAGEMAGCGVSISSSFSSSSSDSSAGSWGVALASRGTGMSN